MARRSGSRSRRNRHGTARSLHPIARRSLHVPSISIRPRPLDLRVFEDRRLFDPFRPIKFSPWPKRVKRGGVVNARIVERARQAPGLYFQAPEKVLVCVRRKQRREVLHARRSLNSGGAKRRNQWSDVKC